MTVRKRTLSHLARALAVSSVVATSSGCDPLPPPHPAVGPTTGSDPNPPPDTTPTLPPDAPDQPMRVTIKVTCDGQKATAAFDIVAGAPGAEVKTTYVPGK